jgi:predicted flap endonuclease-1-like 5' DNA nuclease
MHREINALNDALARIEARLNVVADDPLIATEPDRRASALIAARAQITAALSALERASALPEETAPEPEPSLPRRPAKPLLGDRIVVIERPVGAETFRTKVKLKGGEGPVASERPRPAAALPRTVASEGDNLTRIRGVTPALAAALAAIGVTGFDDIAGWSAATVRDIAGRLDLGRQISQQNWIEQAALLSRARSRGHPTAETDAPVSAHVSAEVSARVVAIASSTAAAGLDKPEPSARAAASASVAPLAVIATSASVMQAPQLPVPIVHSSVVLPPDRLTLIAGLKPAFVGALHAGGVNRWSDIARWHSADVATWQQRLGPSARISRDNWIEQAALLNATGTTAHARLMEAGVHAAIVARPNVEPLVAPLFKPWAATQARAIPPAIMIRTMPADPAMPPTPAPLAQRLSAPLVQPEPPTPLQTRLDQTELARPVLPSPRAPNAAPAAQMAPAPTPSPLHIEDEEFLELSVSEADVVIVADNQRTATAEATVRPTSGSASGSARALLARLKRVPPIDDIDPAHYAAYRDQVEEANVEIVRRIDHLPQDRPTPLDRSKTLSRPTLVPPADRPIHRLLRSITGRG